MSDQVVIIEPFYGGSHKQLVNLITTEITNHALFTLPAKKWPWRARTSALYFSQVIPESQNYRLVFCSSVLNLAELVALRPDLLGLRKVLYFHENQLVYPVRKQQDRDFQYGYNQILSCLVADVVVFNSAYNRDSFLGAIQSFMKLIPDHRPKGLAEQILPKCRVLYFPIKLSPLAVSGFTPDSPGSDVIVKETATEKSDDILLEKCSLSCAHGNSGLKLDSKALTPNNVVTKETYETSYDSVKPSEVTSVNTKSVCGELCINTELTELNTGTIPCLDYGIIQQPPGQTVQPLHIVWAHRWEHDKDPETFFKVLGQLQRDGADFRVSVLGERFQDIPDAFPEARQSLCGHIDSWGYQESKADYSRVLAGADVAVSTALHEFYGVAMLEAADLGCYPLCPNRLVYPEIFPKECLYNTPQQLYKRLRDYCRRPHLVRTSDIKSRLKLARFSWEVLRPKYLELLRGVT